MIKFLIGFLGAFFLFSQGLFAVVDCSVTAQGKDSSKDFPKTLDQSFVYKCSGYPVSRTLYKLKDQKFDIGSISMVTFNCKKNAKDLKGESFQLTDTEMSLANIEDPDFFFKQGINFEDVMSTHPSHTPYAYKGKKDCSIRKIEFKKDISLFAVRANSSRSISEIKLAANIKDVSQCHWEYEGSVALVGTLRTTCDGLLNCGDIQIEGKDESLTIEEFMSFLSEEAQKGDCSKKGAKCRKFRSPRIPVRCNGRFLGGDITCMPADLCLSDSEKNKKELRPAHDAVIDSGENDANGFRYIESGVGK